MHGDEQNGDMGTNLDMSNADQRRDRNVERRRCLEARDTFAFCEGLGLRPPRQVDRRDAERHFGLHHLNRLAVNLKEEGAQRFMSLNNLGERLFDQLRRQIPFDAPAHGDVERGIARVGASRAPGSAAAPERPGIEGRVAAWPGPARPSPRRLRRPTSASRPCLIGLGSSCGPPLRAQWNQAPQLAGA